MPGYAAALAALGDHELEALLERRADLRGGRVPASFGELASRAGAAASVQAALATVDAGTLQLAGLLALIGLPTSVEAVPVQARPGLDEAGLGARLERLAELGIALPRPHG